MSFEATTLLGVHRPTTEDASGAQLVLAVHGYGMAPASMLDFAGRVAPPSAWVAAPAAPSTFYKRVRRQGSRRGGIGYGWIADPERALTDARNDEVLRAALDVMEREHGLDAPRTFLLGYSQGVGVACHFAMRHPERVAGIVGLAGGVPSAERARLTALAGKPVLWITGARDPSYPPAYSAPLLDAWRSAGVAMDAIELDEDHALLEAAAPHVRAWLKTQMASL